MVIAGSGHLGGDSGEWAFRGDSGEWAFRW